MSFNTDVETAQTGSSFFKIMNKISIQNGQLVISKIIHQITNLLLQYYYVMVFIFFQQEVPKLFCLKFGQELDQIIHLKLKNGKEFIASFELLSSSISGLHKLFRKVSMYAESVIIFNYMGESKFEVSVYDSLGIDLLKHITGDFITEEDIQIDSDIEIMLISNTSDTTDSGIKFTICQWDPLQFMLSLIYHSTENYIV